MTFSGLLLKKNRNDVGMACQKICKQGWDNDKSDGEYTKLHLSIFFTLEYLLCKKNAGMALAVCTN